MSQKIYVPCNNSKQEIGAFNHLKVIYIPSGVSVEVSFTHTPRPEEIYPLTDIVADRDGQGNIVEDAKRCFVHITGTSAEDIQLIASNITPEDGYVEVTPLKTVQLQETTKSVLENLTLAALDKIVNKYDDPVITRVNTNSLTEISIFSKLMTCDKVEMEFDCMHSNGGHSMFTPRVDGATIKAIWNLTNQQTKHEVITIEDCKNKTISCNARNTDGYFIYLTVKEYTLKA